MDKFPPKAEDNFMVCAFYSFLVGILSDLFFLILLISGLGRSLKLHPSIPCCIHASRCPCMLSSMQGWVTECRAPFHFVSGHLITLSMHIDHNKNQTQGWVTECGSWDKTVGPDFKKVMDSMKSKVRVLYARCDWCSACTNEHCVPLLTQYSIQQRS